MPRSAAARKKKETVEDLRRARLADVDPEIAELIGEEPRVLREGAAPAAEALERVRAALSS